MMLNVKCDRLQNNDGVSYVYVRLLQQSYLSLSKNASSHDVCTLLELTLTYRPWYQSYSHPNKPPPRSDSFPKLP